MNNNTTAYDLYRKDMASFEILSEEEEYELFRDFAHGDEYARDRIVYSNQKLVTSVAKKYAYIMPLEDLISYGNIGLITAVNRFDYKSGNRFSTFASYWIKHEILRAVEDKSSLLRIPSYMQELIRKYNTAYEALATQLGRTPVDSEVIEALPKDFPVDKYSDVKYYATTSLSSLDYLVGDDDDTCVGDLIADNSFNDFKRSMFNEELSSVTLECFNMLSDTEKTVFELRILNDTPATFKEIGELLGVSKERARQIEASAKAHLKSLVEEYYPGFIF